MQVLVIKLWWSGLAAGFICWAISLTLIFNILKPGISLPTYKTMLPNQQLKLSENF